MMMATTTLRRLLTVFEESSGALTVQSLAAQLELRPERVESMVDFWVNKGRIRVSITPSDCGSCSSQGDCPYILEMPRTYELVTDQKRNTSPASLLRCSRQ